MGVLYRIMSPLHFLENPFRLPLSVSQLQPHLWQVYTVADRQGMTILEPLQIYTGVK